jgi:hypothetical protein
MLKALQLQTIAEEVHACPLPKAPDQELLAVGPSKNSNRYVNNALKSVAVRQAQWVSQCDGKQLAVPKPSGHDSTEQRGASSSSASSKSSVVL